MEREEVEGEANGEEEVYFLDLEMNRLCLAYSYGSTKLGGGKRDG